MNIDQAISKLTEAQRIELQDAMIEAGVVKQLGGNWREVFRRLKHKYKAGYKHKLYARLEKSHKSSVDSGTDVLIEALKR